MPAEARRRSTDGWLSKWREPQVILSVIAMFAAVVMALITTGVAIYQWNLKLEQKIERNTATTNRNEGEITTFLQQQQSNMSVILRSIEAQSDRIESRLQPIEQKLIRIEERLSQVQELQQAYADELERHEQEDAHASAEARIQGNAKMSSERHHPQQRQLDRMQEWIHELDRSMPRARPQSMGIDAKQ